MKKLKSFVKNPPCTTPEQMERLKTPFNKFKGSSEPSKTLPRISLENGWTATIA